MGIKKEIMKKEGVFGIDEDGIIEGRVRLGKGSWRIIGIYRNGNIKRYLRIMEK